jgi:protein TonB
MATQREFLVRLGLTEDADERQVRRAYARELKQIDQERDLEGFQRLRACYEAALKHTARRAGPVPVREPAMAADVESHVEAAVELPVTPYVAPLVAPLVAPPVAPPVARPVAPPAPSAEGWVDPAALGNAVFADFGARMTVLAAQPERMGREESVLLAPWTAALREALADPRLLHLQARAIFEHRIAALLADGWQPGHHLLLPVAVETFGWDRDRRALERLGPAGAHIDAALEQRALFMSQDILARTQQREVLSLLRRRQSPDGATLNGYARALTTLVDYFPTLLGVVAPHEVAVSWRAQITDDMLRSIAPGAGKRRRPWWKGGQSPRLAAGIAMFFLLRLLATLGTHDTPRPQPGYHERIERLRHPKPVYEDEPVTAERIEAIRKAIHYRPGKDVPPGEQAVQFQVVLDADGSILGLNKLKMPSDPAYAVAVEKAIRATGPFPPKTAKAFTLGYHVVLKRYVGVSPERMEEIRQRIDYRPGKDVPPGGQNVRFEVLLSDKGAIRRMKVVEAPGDPAYAAAVEQAIRSTAPFPPETSRTVFIGFHTVKRKPADDH